MTVNPIDSKALHARFLTLINRDSVLLQRCNAYCQSKQKKSLVEFLSNGAEPAAKAALLNELIGILESREFSKLPAAANGQAVDANPKPQAPAVPTSVPPSSLFEPGNGPEVSQPLATPSAVDDLVRQLKAKKAAKIAAEEAARVPVLTEERVGALISAAINEWFQGDDLGNQLRETVRAEVNSVLKPLIEVIAAE